MRKVIYIIVAVLLMGAIAIAVFKFKQAITLDPLPTPPPAVLPPASQISTTDTIEYRFDILGIVIRLPKSWTINQPYTSAHRIMFDDHMSVEVTEERFNHAIKRVDNTQRLTLSKIRQQLEQKSYISNITTGTIASNPALFFDYTDGDTYHNALVVYEASIYIFTGSPSNQDYLDTVSFVPITAALQVEKYPGDNFTAGYIDECCFKGWVYDNDEPTTIRITIQNISNPAVTQTYTGKSGDPQSEFLFDRRNDAYEFMASRGMYSNFIKHGFTLAVGSKDLPPGEYQVLEASYNGKPIKVQDARNLFIHSR